MVWGFFAFGTNEDSFGSNSIYNVKDREGQTGSMDVQKNTKLGVRKYNI